MLERIGIIDLGSNSARLVIFQIYRNRSYNLIHEQKEIVRLSEGVGATNQLQPTAWTRGMETLGIFRDTCRRFEVEKVIAVATAAVRNASNGPEFVNQAKEKYGFEFEILSGAQEAYYGFLGIINTLPESDYLQFDLGGGSIELVWVQNRQIKKSVSLPFGAVTLMEKFGLQDQFTAKNHGDFFKWLQKNWKGLEWLKKAKKLPLIGTGGTIRTLAKMDQRRKNYPFSKLHNYRMGAITFRDLYHELSNSNLKERKKIPGLNDGRADLILAGSGIIYSLLDYLASPRIVVSGSGVREGIFFEYYRNLAGKPAIIGDILRHSAENMAGFYNTDRSHADRVVNLSKSMFILLQKTLELESRDLELLKASSLLHDVGIVINYYHHARHSAYLIENGTLYGLSHREQILCAVLAAWHGNTNLKQVRRYYSQFLDEIDWIKAKRMGMILAIAEILEESQSGLVQEMKADIYDKKVVLHLFCRARPDTELQFLRPIQKNFHKETGKELALEIHLLSETKK